MGRACADGLPFASPEQALILASIVEKETSLPEERRHIAAVFINRLKTGMKLQSDPTIIYGITKGYPLGRRIRQSEIEARHALQHLCDHRACRRRRSAIPARIRWRRCSARTTANDLYFVANGKGGHVFAATIAPSIANVAAWRAIERAKDRHNRAPVGNSQTREALPRQDNGDSGERSG